MTDILIRDVPDDVVAAIDARAQRLGVSRTEYLRRALARAGMPSAAVSVDDLVALAATVGDLDDRDVMRDAWQ